MKDQDTKLYLLSQGHVKLPITFPLMRGLMVILIPSVFCQLFHDEYALLFKPENKYF